MFSLNHIFILLQVQQYSCSVCVCGCVPASVGSEQGGFFAHFVPRLHFDTGLFVRCCCVVPRCRCLGRRHRQYFTKGSASLCGVVELINEDFSDEAIQKQVEDRLMPRTEELPIYNMQEFNDKVIV